MSDEGKFVRRKESAEMELRKAKANEAEICYQCIEDARAYHKSLGFEQWRPDYPTRETILEDIAQNMGYTFVDEQGIIGYCCIIIGDEPAYRQIEGLGKRIDPMLWFIEWLSIKRQEAADDRRKRLT